MKICRLRKDCKVFDRDDEDLSVLTVLVLVLVIVVAIVLLLVQGMYGMKGSEKNLRGECT
eukprot:scaffold13340_cov212-Alexandrium_tamarense.AAC.32